MLEGRKFLLEIEDLAKLNGILDKTEIRFGDFEDKADLIGHCIATARYVDTPQCLDGKIAEEPLAAVVADEPYIFPTFQSPVGK